VSTSNPVPTNIKNKSSMDGNVMLGKLNYRKCSMFVKDTVLKYHILFPPTVYTFLIFCFSNKLRKRDLEHFLVTDIIGINTHFRVRTTYKEFQSSNTMISQGLTMLNVSKQKQLPPLHTTVTT
jgi:hypothetical protein